MHCLRCQSEVPEGISDCPGCGVPAASPCSSCGTTLDRDFKFCPGCGASRASRPAPSRRPFRGRREEVARLLAFAGSLEENPQPHLAAVVGDPGIGKTRLLEEVLAGIRSRRPGQEGPLYLGRHTTILRGEAPPFGGRPCEPLLAPLREIFQVREGEVPARVREQVGRGMRVLFPWEEDEERRYLEESATFLLCAPEGDLLAALEPRQVRGRLFRSLRKVLASVARTGPVVLALDDLHWADGMTLDFLASVAAFLEDVPILVLMASRGGSRVPGRVRTVLERGACRDLPLLEMILEPLGEEDSQRIVGDLLGGAGSEALTHRIAGWSGGNPFYASEMAHWTRERSDEREGAPPASVHEVVEARIEALEETERLVLGTAATVGVVFWEPLLSLLLGEAMGEERLRAALESLLRRGHIEETAGDPPAWRFHHAYLQEVAYTRVSAAERKRLHRRIAAWLEEHYPGGTDEILYLLALHLQRAGDPARALPVTLRAADRARFAWNHDQAARLYREALELTAAAPGASDGDDLLSARAAASEGLAWLKHLGGAHETAAGLFETARELEVQRNASAARIADLERGIARARMARGEYDLALASYRRASKRLGEDGPPTARARLLIGEAKVLIRRGDTQQASALTRCALELVDADGPEAADAYDNLGLVHYYRGPRSRAIVYWVRSLDIRKRLGLTPAVATSWNNLGAAYQGEGDTTRALDAFGRSLAIAEQVGDLYQAAVLQNNLGVLHMERGDLDDARAILREALSRANQTGNRYVEALAWNNLAELRLHTGELEAAGEALDRCEDLAGEMGSRGLLPDVQRLRGELHLSREEPEDALVAATRAVELARTLGSRSDEANALRLRGRALAAMDQPSRAAEAFEEALAIHREMEDQPNLARTLRSFGLLLHARPDASSTHQAEPLLREAGETFEALGLRPWPEDNNGEDAEGDHRPAASTTTTRAT